MIAFLDQDGLEFKHVPLNKLAVNRVESAAFPAIPDKNYQTTLWPDRFE